MLLLLLMACKGDGATAFEAGDYTFWTLAVTDGCLDGALEATFMPEGPATAWEWEFPVYVPGTDELPFDDYIDFREPFVGMPVTITATPDGLGITGSEIQDVILNDNLYGDCGADIRVDASITPTESDRGTGTAELDLDGFQGSEGRCPPVDEDPCRVELTMELQKL